MSWGTLGAVVVGAAVLAWGLADQWLPHVRPRIQNALHSIQRTGTEALALPGRIVAPSMQAPASAPVSAAPLRKCVDRQGRTTYADQPCPHDAREQEVGGAVTVLPSTTTPEHRPPEAPLESRVTRDRR